MSDSKHYLESELDNIFQSNPDIIEWFSSRFNDGLVYWDLEQPANVWLSPGFWKLLGNKPESKKHLYSEWEDVIFQEDLKLLMDNLKKISVDQSFPCEQVVRYYHKDGSTVWARCRGVLIQDAGGKPIRMIGAHTDLTALKTAYLATKASESKLRVLLESTDDLITQVDKDGCFIYLSPSCQKYYGRSVEDCIGRVAFDFLHPDDQVPTREAFSRWLLAGEESSFSFVNRQLHVSGKIFTMLWNISAIKDENGEILFFNSIARDVTEKEQQKAKLVRNEALLREVESLANVGGWTLDLNDESIYWTKQVYNIYELQCSTPLKLPFVLSFYSEKSRCKLDKAISELIEKGKGYDLELELRTALGNEIWVRTKGRPVYLDQKLVRLTGSIQDITGRKGIESDLLEAQKLLKRQLSLEANKKNAALYELKLAAEVFKNSLEGITITDVDANVVDVNKAFTEITGYSRDEILGKPIRLIKSDRHDEVFYQILWRTLLDEGAWAGEIWNRRKSGEVYIQRTSISAVIDCEGATTHYVAVFSDITELKASEEHIVYQANHDALTGLPNRNLLKDRLDVAFSRARRNGNKVALLFLDLDDFKRVNDSLGHVMGDQLLQESSKRIEKAVRDGDTVARIGGDEFIIMMENVDGVQEVIALSQRIKRTFLQSFQIGDHDIVVTCSIGIALYPEDGDNADILIRNADMAMYRAKKTGKDSYQLFTQSLHQEVRRRLHLENDLRRAIENGEIEVYYQPKIETVTGKIYGLEALVRWRKNDGQIVSPIEFIPLAESVGLIHPLGDQVLIKTCAFAKELELKGYDLQLAVNLSLKQFRQVDLVDKVLDFLTHADLEPTSLELEITESAIMRDVEKTISQLNKLSEASITLSIDDFGTGYSSLSYLKDLPISVLKIDRSFIRGLPENTKDMKIVSAIQSLANSFEVKTVAEGVETLDQLLHLKSIGCDAIQGYFFSPPIPASDVIDFLESHQGDIQ